MLNLIKIDPEKRTIEMVQTAGTLEDMYGLIGCDLIDVCARQDNGDALTVDDDFLFKDTRPVAFSFGEFGPIYGTAILAGLDGEGETAEPTLSLEEAKDLVGWIGDANIFARLSYVVFV